MVRCADSCCNRLPIFETERGTRLARRRMQSEWRDLASCDLRMRSAQRLPRAKVRRSKQPCRPFYPPLVQKYLERPAEAFGNGPNESGPVAAEQACKCGDPGRRTRRVALSDVMADDG